MVYLKSKTLNRTVATLVFSFVFATAGAWAQRPNGGGDGRHLDRLAVILGLTEAQKTSAQGIFTAARTESEPVTTQLRTDREALQTAVKAGRSDAELTSLATPIGTRTGQLAAINARAQAKFYALLTAEQKAKLDQLRGPGPFGGGFGPMHGRGGPLPE